MRKRNKCSDWCIVVKSTLGGIGLGLATYVAVLFFVFLWEKLS